MLDLVDHHLAEGVSLEEALVRSGRRRLRPILMTTFAGVAAAWLGLIEGVSDGLSSFAKMASGYYTDRFRRRKPIAVAGYVVTALGTAAFGMASAAWHVLLARSLAWLGRGVRTPVRKALLAGGYALAALMAGAIILLPVSVWTLALVFAAGGIYVAVEETLEDSLCAELVGEAHHGMAFGTLATVNGVGDFLSSVIVGALWTWAGTTAAFGYCAVLFVAGAGLALRVAKE
ncbi:MAG TPA: hypothetical protein P5555_10265 [Candidatus Paceibacterota bacterium]|nr:hypothetical protein [Verrucomicrobiota bacterium]HRZ45562.1 hypothetical protein [Candidatus Paceibacterota bacterium]